MMGSGWEPVNRSRLPMHIAIVFSDRNHIPRLARWVSIAMWCIAMILSSVSAGPDSTFADDLFSGDPFAEAPTLPEDGSGRPDAEDAPVPLDPDPADEPPPAAKPAPVDASSEDKADHLAAPRSAPPVVTLSLRLPITGNRDTRFIASAIRQLPTLRSNAGQRGVLVVRFDGEEEGPSDFGRALEIARFLSGRQFDGVKTVAWLPRAVEGHAVLAVLACEEIVMSANAALGPVLEDPSTVDEAMRAAYAEIASRRQSFPSAVAVAMADPMARAFRITTPEGEFFVGSREEVDTVGKNSAVLDVAELGPSPLVFSARNAREAGFVRWLADTPEEVAEGLDVAVSTLKVDPSLNGGWRAVQISLVCEPGWSRRLKEEPI
jgi:hypothetical protein